MTRTTASALLLGFVSPPARRPQNSFPPFDVELLPSAAADEPQRLRVTLALAGFAADDLQLSVENGELILRGRRPSDDGDRAYLYRGIAMRSFERRFPLSEGAEIVRAHLEEGLLTIELARPEHQRTTRKVDITAPV